MDIVLNTTFSNSALPVAQYAGFTDSFNAADGVLDYTEDGKAWIKTTGTGSGVVIWERVSGAAKLQSPSITSIAVADGLAANGVLTTTIGAVGTSRAAAIVLRYVDRSNYIFLGMSAAGTPTRYQLRKLVAGVASNVATSATGANSADVVAVTMSGTSFSVSVNGTATSIAGVTVSDFSTATKHGFTVNGADLTTTFNACTFVAAP
jgi:hypothetical protein